MKTQDLIKSWKRMADEAGKPFTIDNRKRGIRIVCGGQSVLMPARNREIAHPRHIERRLGLS